MQVEHIAFNVADPLAVARWYVEHMGFSVKRRIVEPPWTHFLIDESGRTMFEIYGQPQAPVPDYETTDPLVLHVAFVSQDLAADMQRLIAAGATPVGEIQETPNGDQLAMLRDPWGLAIQLVKRAKPMI